MKTAVLFDLFVRQLLRRAQTRLSRIAVRIAWRFLLDPQRYIWLRDLVLETPDGPVTLGRAIVSTRGVFVIETAAAGKLAPTDDFERVNNAASRYEDLVRYSEAHSRLVARALAEDGCVVRPVVVFADPRALPQERPANVVSEFGLALYIRSFKFHFYSNQELQDIASRLLRPPLPLSKLAA